MAVAKKSSPAPFTPGPWRVEVNTDRDYTFTIYDADGNYPSLTEAQVASILKAAPDLLAACELIIRDSARWGLSLGCDEEVRAAIRKATGQE